MSRCILQHAPGSQGAEAYTAIAKILDNDSASGAPGGSAAGIGDVDHEPSSAPSIMDPVRADEELLSSATGTVPSRADRDR
jgi:hypothetical protein